MIQEALISSGNAKEPIDRRKMRVDSLLII